MSAKQKSYRLGVDSGGTFTDVCAIDQATGELFVWKVNSTPDDPSAGIAEAVRSMNALIADRDGGRPEIVLFGHGTTVATNALIERKGAPTALITTLGFRDVLEIARQRRPELYDIQTMRPLPLVPRDLRFEVSERIQHDGSVLTPLDEAQVVEIARLLRRADILSVAVSFLFSFLNPSHEQRVREILEAELPGVFISLSAEVAPEFREFERTSTTVMNSYLGPLMRNYIRRLGDRLKGEIPDRILVTQSNGGMISAEVAAAQPVRMVLSGPSAGVSGALTVARRLGRGNLITFDMGGTSADVAVITDFEPHFKAMAQVGGFPVKVPMIDIHAVGAGGGSLARADHGLLKVGPQSAGAHPGPVCYGLGNRQPTVTDANVALGILNQTHLLNGRMPIDAAASRQALHELGEKLGLGMEQTAAGILEVVTANMVHAIRLMTVERGLDPRSFSLFSFGGAGPLHSSYLARELSIAEIIVPTYPGIMCASGLLTGGVQKDFVNTHYETLRPESMAGLIRHFSDMLGQANKWFADEAVAIDRRRLSTAIDLRYVGQSYELTVPFSTDARGAGHDELVEAFHKAHSRKYGYLIDGEDIQVTAIRVEASAPLAVEEHPVERDQVGMKKPAPLFHRDVFDIYERRWFSTPVYAKQGLAGGVELPGPCIVEQMDATTFVMHGQAARIDERHNIIITNRQYAA